MLLFSFVLFSLFSHSHVFLCGLFVGGEEGGPQKKIDMGQKMEGVDVVVAGGKKSVVKEEKNSSCVGIDGGVGAAAHSETLKPEEEEEAIKPAVTVTARQDQHHRWCCLLFTEAQRRELDLQVLIFNHFACNLPLPHHLVLPFFNSAGAGSGTFGSGFGNFRKQFPIYMSGFVKVSDHAFFNIYLCVCVLCIYVCMYVCFFFKKKVFSPLMDE